MYENGQEITSSYHKKITAKLRASFHKHNNLVSLASAASFICPRTTVQCIPGKHRPNIYYMVLRSNVLATPSPLFLFNLHWSMIRAWVLHRKASNIKLTPLPSIASDK